MTEVLETTVDKFTFRVLTDRLYSPEGVWVQPEGSLVRIGLSDDLQQRSGDVAFAQARPEGERVRAGDELATIETIKVNISLPAPVGGTVVRVNPDLAQAPEVINQDPYGKGWLVMVEAADWPAEQGRLLDPQAYFSNMKQKVEREAGK